MVTRYLLDTNMCIYIAKHSPPHVRERFAQYTTEQLALSVVTLGELRFGAEKSQARAKALAVIAQLTDLVPIFPMPERAGVHYGEIRALLQKQGQPIGNNDLWIAAHALAENWIVVTNNESEFLRVPGLRVENWARP